MPSQLPLVVPPVALCPPASLVTLPAARRADHQAACAVFFRRRTRRSPSCAQSVLSVGPVQAACAAVRRAVSDECCRVRRSWRQWRFGGWTFGGHLELLCCCSARRRRGGTL